MQERLKSEIKLYFQLFTKTGRKFHVFYLRYFILSAQFCLIHCRITRVTHCPLRVPNPRSPFPFNAIFHRLPPSLWLHLKRLSENNPLVILKKDQVQSKGLSNYSESLRSSIGGSSSQFMCGRPFLA